MRKIRRYQSTYSLTTFFAVLYFSGDILMLSTFFFFFFGSVLHYSVTARDTITPGDWLRDDGKTLVSAGKTFELGFFSPNGSSKNGRFVGIWYYMSEPPRIVWVANRDRPLFPLSHTTSGVFAIKEDGKLKVLGKNGSVHWASGIETSSSSAGRVVKLMDSGNLVLSDNRSGEILWESFRNPTDTFLPGMKMDEDLQLTSWLTSVDPASGNYTFELEGGNNNEYIITDKYNSVSSRWKSKEMEGTSEGVKGAILSLLSNFSEASSSADFDGDESLEIPSSPDKNSSLLVMSFSGEIQFYPNPNSSSPSWKAPKDRCSVSKACGKFGSCNINNDFMCKCLPGFVPVLPHSWKNGEFSGGCSRKTPICPKKTGKAVFLTLPMMQVRKPDFYWNRQHGKGSDYCRKKCLSDCLCQAYAETNYTHGRGVITLECLIWNDDLTGLQEESGPGSYYLSVLVAVSDIKPTARNCETCGSNMIPYPLSTGPNCGDPMYSNFECNITTGQVEFKVPGGALRVTSINPGKLRFEVQLKDADCNPRSLNDNIPQLNPPFHMTEACREVRTKDGVVVEISWDPPLEQVCTLSADCKDLQNSTCTTKNETRRCFCNENFEWNSTSLNCVPGGGNPAVSASPANLKSSSSSSPVVLIGITIALALVLGLGITAYFLKRTIAKRKEKREIGRRLCLSESRVKDLIDSEHFKEDDKIGIDVPFFDIEDILVATDNFSNANMLGRGGFGPVYKGKFPEGQEIAVKRLSRASGQGMLEFKNEVVLIAKLQHRNLVRLLGYCIEGDEKILLYEYLPNKSLDSFIFDPTSCKILNWEKRFDIILGIARGLLYLHQDSRLKIIHRDLKTSNILLDDKMNPKISDFGLAKILESKQVEANTNRVVGTYGYMSPEYALDGLFSEKSDVYSYGVMVLEIISGKRNIGFYHSDQILNLLGYAWKLWKEEKVLELMDQTLIETCDTNEFSRCASVGLLCVQEDPSDRPTMRVALMMLNSDTATTMPVPKQPAFVVKRDFSSTASSSSSKPEASGNMVVLTSIGEGR